jgi:hypothetical protein
MPREKTAAGRRIRTLENVRDYSNARERQLFVIANCIGVLSERTREANSNGRRDDGCRHDGDARQINQKPVGVKFNLCASPASEANNALAPFQKIWTPIQSSMNEDSRRKILVPLRPSSRVMFPAKR